MLEAPKEPRSLHGAVRAAPCRGHSLRTEITICCPHGRKHRGHLSTGAVGKKDCGEVKKGASKARSPAGWYQVRTSRIVTTFRRGATMKFTRRQFLQLAGSAAAATAQPRQALALDYPAQPVRMIVP